MTTIKKESHLSIIKNKYEEIRKIVLFDLQKNIIHNSSIKHSCKDKECISEYVWKIENNKWLKNAKNNKKIYDIVNNHILICKELENYKTLEQKIDYNKILDFINLYFSKITIDEIKLKQMKKEIPLKELEIKVLEDKLKIKKDNFFYQHYDKNPIDKTIVQLIIDYNNLID